MFGGAAGVFARGTDAVAAGVIGVLSPHRRRFNGLEQHTAAATDRDPLQAVQTVGYSEAQSNTAGRRNDLGDHGEDGEAG